MSKHTPGPWKIDAASRQLDRTTFKDRRWLYQINDGCEPAPEAQANARLIAAAPDLLAALRAIIDWDDGKRKDRLVALFNEARAAIARAEGGE